MSALSLRLAVDFGRDGRRKRLAPPVPGKPHIVLIRGRWHIFGGNGWSSGATIAAAWSWFQPRP